MAAEIIKEFFGTRIEDTGTAGFVEIIAAADRAPTSEGVLVANTGTAALEVNDNGDDLAGWYSIPPGSTFFVPFAPILGVFVKGSTNYKLQQARVTP